jgi:hypothetical protein
MMMYPGHIIRPHKLNWLFIVTSLIQFLKQNIELVVCGCFHGDQPLKLTIIPLNWKNSP